MGGKYTRVYGSSQRLATPKRTYLSYSTNTTPIITQLCKVKTKRPSLIILWSLAPSLTILQTQYLSFSSWVHQVVFHLWGFAYLFLLPEILLPPNLCILSSQFKYCFPWEVFHDQIMSSVMLVLTMIIVNIYCMVTICQVPFQELFMF